MIFEISSPKTFKKAEKMKKYTELTKSELLELYAPLKEKYEAYCESGLKLDISRGKPNAEQLDVSQALLEAPLTKEDIEKIIDIELKGLKKRVKETGFDLTITPAAKRFVADAGFDPSYGARPLKRAIRKYIEDPVSEHIISERMFGRIVGSEARKLRISLSKDKETTTVEWK